MPRPTAAASNAAATPIQNHVFFERPKNSSPEELPDRVSPARATITFEGLLAVTEGMVTVSLEDSAAKTT